MNEADGLKLYRAVVENNNDETVKNGRVKVRIFGIHTEMNSSSEEEFNTIDTEHLPWAEVMGGTSFGLVGGVGLSSVLRQGTWVWVVLDHGNPNKPIIIGTITGIVSEDSKEKQSNGQGFYDPDEIYPFTARSAEADFNRHARNEKLTEESYDNPVSIYASKDTVHKQINDNVDVVSINDGVSGADVSQTEPNSLNDGSEYPNVAILETHSGHQIELDDTPENERIRVYHTSGSYIEIRPDGTFIQKSVNTNAESHYIHMSDVHKHIAKGVKEYIEANKEEIIGGNLMSNIKGTTKIHSEQDVTWKIGGNLTIDVSGNINITSGGTQTNANGGDYTHTAPNIFLN